MNMKLIGLEPAPQEFHKNNVLLEVRTDSV